MSLEELFTPLLKNKKYDITVSLLRDGSTKLSEFAKIYVMNIVKNLFSALKRHN